MSWDENRHPKLHLFQAVTDFVKIDVGMSICNVICNVVCNVCLQLYSWQSGTFACSVDVDMLIL